MHEQHDNPFAEATQRLSHISYAMASLAEQHNRRAATRTHAEAAALERSGEQVQAPGRGSVADQDPEMHGRVDSADGVSPRPPTESATLADSADLAAAGTARSRSGDDRIFAAHEAATPDDPGTPTVNEHAEGLTHAATDTAAASQQAALATDKTSAALAKETYPHALNSVSVHSGRAAAQPATPRSLQQSAVRQGFRDSTPLPRR
ncbi:MAG: hypothetical protein H0T78_05230 [Longispora sp.]|nr:hypothetical protein [Longispora sp. (in: high G+C Gram-positive bacteria)]